ncbi:42530_t:CDS:2 [Gigaspora margarita]|uniref:42530_t:CDS:1 n=1 Tax=Gigaspora margarita TaxID=4874 RepID=A0ABN7UU94_GIGMA|nr:42530_t:CDS:2 [Gigaspora margarita]
MLKKALTNFQKKQLQTIKEIAYETLKKASTKCQRKYSKNIKKAPAKYQKNHLQNIKNKLPTNPTKH